MPDLSQFTGQIIAFLAGAAPYLKLALPHLKGAAQVATDAAIKEGGKQVGGAITQKAATVLATIRTWFTCDANTKGQKVLDLVEDDPEDEDQRQALAKQIYATLANHPEWADELRPLLQEDAIQEIIATNSSWVEDVTMSITGSGKQRIEANQDSVVTGVKMNIKRS